MFSNGLDIRNELFIPYAGWRYYVDASVSNMGNAAYLWSSSPDPELSYNSRNFTTDVGGVSLFNSRAFAFSVRCFYDSYDYFKSTVTYNLN